MVVGLQALRGHHHLGAVPAQALDHPVERQVGQPAALVAAADVGVHAGKPHLLDALVAAMLGLPPHGRLELHAVLVDGQRMAGVVDDAADVGVVELEAAPADPVQPRARDAERAHRVEHAEEAHAHVGVREAAQLLLVGREALLGPGAVVGPGELLVARIAHVGAQQAAGRQEPAQAARRVGAARVAEDVDVVARPVVERQEAVGLQDVGAQPRAEQPAGQPMRAAAAGADAGVVIDVRRRPEPGLRIDHRGEQADVGLMVGAVRVVPGSVQADDQAGHTLTPKCAVGIAWIDAPIRPRPCVPARTRRTRLLMAVGWHTRAGGIVHRNLSAGTPAC